jgi:predicted PurR-regulated permease PerM
MFGTDARAARATWTVLLIVIACAVVFAIRTTILVFIAALLLAYLLLPLVDFIDARLPLRRSRTPALAIVYLTLMAVIVGASIAVGSRVVEQAGILAQKIPDLAAAGGAAQLPLPEALRPFAETIAEQIRGYLSEHAQELLSQIPKAGLRAVGFVASLVFVVIVPILSFFFLKDGRDINHNLIRLFRDPAQRAVLSGIGEDLNLLLAQYMRALVLLALATFTCYAVFFELMGVPYALLLAAIAFPLEFVPMIGPLTASAVILVVAGFSGYSHLLAVVGFLILFRLFQDYVLQPHLMSSGIELHPLAVIFGVFAGEQIGGIAGAFLSVPVIATLRVLYRRMAVPADTE